ncbi:MAG: hypothetical protein JOY94_20910, partial [Methylobacteriaceae bacterium]|nr:hypothetical protein [Methylobacteriaceae bacterium]
MAPFVQDLSHHVADDFGEAGRQGINLLSQAINLLSQVVDLPLHSVEPRLQGRQIVGIS